MEQFSIPGAGAIILSNQNGRECVLLQERFKEDAPDEEGMLEIPAGKIRASESIFDTIRREVKEETGLDVSEIEGENTAGIYVANGYKVLNFKPFSCSQNIEGGYPIMVFTFICRAEGNLLPESNESKNYRWADRDELRRLLEKKHALYPMHRDTLIALIEDTRLWESGKK